MRTLIIVTLLLASPPAFAQGLQRRHVYQFLKEPVCLVALSADGAALAAAARRVETKTWKRWTEFAIWDTSTHKKHTSFEGHTDGASAIALSPDGNLLASSTDAGRMLLWSVKQNGERNVSSIVGSTPTLAFSADGKDLAGASMRSILHLTSHGDNPVSLPFRGRHGHRAFSPDLRLLACARHQDVDLVDTATGKLQSFLPDHPGTVNHFAFSGDGKTLAVVVTKVDEAGYDSEVFIWDLAKQSVKARLKDLGYCSSVMVNHDGSHLVVIADKKLHAFAHELKSVNVATGKVTSSIRLQRTQTPRAHAMSRDGKVLAVGCEDGSIQVFDLK